MVKSFIICEVKVEDLREENQKRETIVVSTGVPTGVVVVRILENEKDKKESLKLTRKIQVQVVRVKERERQILDSPSYSERETMSSLPSVTV